MTKKFKQKTISDSVARIQRKGKKNSEFQSYTYIKNELRELGWNVRNPNRAPSGQLYTQHECLGHPEIKLMLGKLTPEYVVKVTENVFWVIEAKPTHEQIDQAYEEASGYGERINNHEFYRALIISGVAGNDLDRYVVKSGFWEEEKRKFTPITFNEREITSLISPTLATTLLVQKSPHLKDLRIDEKEYISLAEKINQVFHEASIKKDTRAGVVASILLSLLAETEPNPDDNPEVFVKDINNRAQDVLTKNDKGHFFQYITVYLPEKIDAQIKFKEALVSAFFLLKKVNIKSAMRAGSDILGKFYEGFLKYGNGAKDLGILLTPRHITEFASKVLDITHSDIIYDPTCGTSGFLVSAFYHVKKHSTPVQLDIFKQHRIFGIDQEPTITALAIVNMIFRGDGKNNIMNDDCLARALIPKIEDGVPSAQFVSAQEGLEYSQRPVTKVLMNPPFAQSEKEYRFVDHALEQMENGGLLFSVLPVSIMIKGGKVCNWRKKLLRNNTLLSVITFPPDLFYQAGSSQHTVGVFVRKGKPHDREQKTLWIRAINDGLAKKKGKRLPNPRVPDDLSKVETLLRSFIQNSKIPVNKIPAFQASSLVDFSDDSFELIPEAYLDGESYANINEEVKQLVREFIAFKIVHEVELNQIKKSRTPVDLPDHKTIETIGELFTIDYGQKEYHNKENLKSGKTLLISSQGIDNGCYGFFDEGVRYTRPLVTVPSTGSIGKAFVQLYECCVDDNCLTLIPKKKLSINELYYVAAIIRRESWRFRYGRQITPSRLGKFEVNLSKFSENHIRRFRKRFASLFA